MERITSNVIAEKEFTIESRGYSKDEVDTFLDLICEEMDRLNNEIQDLRQKTTMVRPAAPAAENTGVSKESEERFREILEMAATVKEETIRKAREDAEAIRLKAETEAGERLNGLVQEQEDLEKEVSALRQAAADYRRQFEELLHAQQEALEKATGLF
ncbi:MAG: DivIVA domain-containing protein [Clostridia bacterium]|nr:DivIVA domain-containing protein [Clostridia bacterium]